LNAKLKLRNLLLLTQTHQVCISTREQPFWQTCMTIAASAPVTWWLPHKSTVHKDEQVDIAIFGITCPQLHMHSFHQSSLKRYGTKSSAYLSL